MMNNINKISEKDKLQKIDKLPTIVIDRVDSLSPIRKDSNNKVNLSNSPIRRKSILKNGSDSFFGSPQNKQRKQSRVSFNLIDEVWRSELIQQHAKDQEKKKDLKSQNNIEATTDKKEISLDISNNIRTVNLDVKNNPAIYITTNNKNNYSIINNVNYPEQNKDPPKPKPIAPFKKRNSVVVGLTDRKRFMLNKDSVLDEMYYEKNSFTKNSQIDSERRKSFLGGLDNKNPQLMINIYKIRNEKEIDEKRRNEESFTKLQTLNDFRKQEHKQLLDDPNYFKLVYEKKVGDISGFCANTFKNFKNKNEDKINVGINLKLKNQNYFSEEKKIINYFSVFDGHGGESVAEELRLNLRDFILADLNFLEDTEGAILRAFDKIEDSIIVKNKSSDNNEAIIDKSGSCAILALLISNFKFNFR